MPGVNEGGERQHGQQKPMSRRRFIFGARDAFLAVAAAPLLPKPGQEGLKGSVPKERVNKPEAGRNFEVVDRAETASYIVTTRETPILLVPTRKDGLYDDKFPITEITLSDAKIQTYGVHTVRDENGNGFRVAPVSNLTGDREIALAILERGTFDRAGKFSRTEAYYTTATRPDTNTGAAYTYLAETLIYPNKIVNLTTGLMALARYQEENGPFKPGVTYSLLEIVGMHDRENAYVNGKTSSGAVVKAGGICGLASTLAKTLHLGGGSFPEPFSPHPSFSTYYVPPMGDGRITARNSMDATIEDPGGGARSFDVTFSVPRESYIAIDVDIVPNGVTSPDELTPPSDALFAFTLTLQTARPTTTSESIEQLRTAYADFRRTGRSGNLLGQKCEIEGVFPIGATRSEMEVIRNVYPQERTWHYERELQTDPFLREVSMLRGVIREYKSRNPQEMVEAGAAPKLGEYLKKHYSDWYMQKQTSLNETQLAALNSALNHLDNFTYVWDGQPVQCVGYMILLAALGHPNCPRPIGGINTPHGASDLIPDTAKAGRYRENFPNGFSDFNIPMTDLRPGDLFVQWNPNDFTKAGHVGTILAEKMVNGKRVLLISDSNRLNDGLPIITEVDENNVDIVVGVQSGYKYRYGILRKP